MRDPNLEQWERNQHSSFVAAEADIIESIDITTISDSRMRKTMVTGFTRKIPYEFLATDDTEGGTHD